jgi:hypothetical protein
MKIYDAIMAAAEHIEKFSASYAFSQGVVPRGLMFEARQKAIGDAYGPGGYPCCMLARIGAYTDQAVPEGTYIGHDDVARRDMGVDTEHFYARICAITTEQTGTPNTIALHNPVTIPNAMREYARRYHGIPQAVAQIFECGTVIRALEHA